MEATVPFKKQKDRPLIGEARDLNRFVVCQQRDSKGRKSIQFQGSDGSLGTVKWKHMFSYVRRCYVAVGQRGVIICRSVVVQLCLLTHVMFGSNTDFDLQW